MSLSKYFCGLCGESYAVTQGCAICEPAKARIETANTNVKLDPVEGVDQSLRILRRLLQNVETELQDSTLLRKFELVKDATKLAESYAKLMESRRRYENDAPATLGFTAELEVFMRWIDELPPTEREKLLGRVTQLALPPAPPEPNEEEAEVISDE